MTQLSFGTICNNRKHKLQFDGIGDELVELHASAVGEIQQGIFDTAADLATRLAYFTNNKSSTTPFHVENAQVVHKNGLISPSGRDNEPRSLLAAAAIRTTPKVAGNRLVQHQLNLKGDSMRKKPAPPRHYASGRP